MTIKIINTFVLTSLLSTSIALCSIDHKNAATKSEPKITIDTPEQSTHTRDQMYFSIDWSELKNFKHKFIDQAIERYCSNNKEMNKDEFRNEVYKKLQKDYSKAKESNIIKDEIENFIIQLNALKNTVEDFAQEKNDTISMRSLLNDINLLEKYVRYYQNRRDQLPENQVDKIYKILNAFLNAPGSIIYNILDVSKDSNNPVAKYIEFYNQEMTKLVKINENGTINDSTIFCPDQRINGYTIKELFPFFTEQSFLNGLNASDLITGDRKPLAKVKLNGRWWNVYAYDISTENQYEDYYIPNEHTINNGFSASYPKSVYEIATPYAIRMGESLNTLLTDSKRYEYINNQYNTHEQSIQSKKLQDALKDTNNGLFWKRDTTFSDSQSQICTYTASSIIRNYPYMHTIKNYQFSFEPTQEQNNEEFENRQNSFLERVYAERRSYYIRQQNLGQYELDYNDNVISAQQKIMGEFKERIARDRVYQERDPLQKMEDGRVYKITPSRIYRSSYIRDGLSKEAIEHFNNQDYQDRIYYYNRQADSEYGKSNEYEAQQRFNEMTRGSVNQENVTSANSRVLEKIDQSSNEEKHG